ncbi:hypothetical protein G6F46_000563 [Rhizopus delemar]|uniref:NADH dehydrogenase [ubiquinone] 1 alpha subcomplex subunit n=3 Tax=Rhizopus TaxID=4842 RepID=I1CGD0_RHIO9|nr:hypothetical protein RO3G_12221 [Rhizopus delemar RA 99-880]KAG1047296.1 hypothetical protein G6F43_010247 [Rhizopus delemar]KAG1547956.1 hypothetical protein G6F51_003950 [Rhizopus arrhizus]KAG1464266.1 hypothetical protein G6F55_001891 [Rhizopus delemar]KAG1501316.1 hypothetical protein G6F54_003121 [Rhizopus delemar]|eukprot:EIE87510.1 hypothetical protein RO3G_12221 [Rhizopus delemar RA 99-880]
MSKSAGLLGKLSLAYKTNRFPWKKHALVGYDLAGNEYWDCPNPLGGRMKRWVQMKETENNDATIFNQNLLPVQWQAWLRHTRQQPPSIVELVQEEKRREIVLQRAKALDEEWEQRKLQIEEERERERVLEEVKKDEKVQPKTTEPSGQGDTFTPGEWNPVSSKR